MSKTTTTKQLDNASLDTAQPIWHAWSAAEYFCNSLNSRISVRYRSEHRENFIHHATAGIRAIGVEAFLERFKVELKGNCRPCAENMAEGEAVMRAIAAKLLKGGAT